MLSEKHPSLLRVIQIDYWSFIAAMFVLIFWVFYVYDFFITKNQSQTYLYWMIPFTIMCVVLVFWRYARVMAIYNTGLDAKAIVSGVGFFRDRGRISFVYNYMGQKYESRVSVMRTRRTKQYQVGDEIDVLVDRENPRKAVIRDLYI